MRNNPVGWFEIYVQDIPRAKTFYETVFQTKLESIGPPGGELEMWSFPGDMNSYGIPGALVKMQGVSSGLCSTIIYFSCEDCAVETQRALANGGKLQKAKESIGQYGFIALVYDTEGNMIGLHSMN